MVATKGYQSRDRSTSTTRAGERTIEVVVSVSGSSACAIREGGGFVERKRILEDEKGRSSSQKAKPASRSRRNAGAGDRRRTNKCAWRVGGSEGRGWQCRQRQTTGFTVERRDEEETSAGGGTVVVGGGRR